MRAITIVTIAGILLLPIHAHAQASGGQNMRALNPQPEPPGQPRQSKQSKQFKQLKIKKQSAPQMRQGDMRKLNPQPEPPSSPGLR